MKSIINATNINITINKGILSTNLFNLLRKGINTYPINKVITKANPTDVGIEVYLVICRGNVE